MSEAAVGLVDGVDVGLGLFALHGICSGTFLGEYTGVLMRRSEDDVTYGYSLPVVDPDLVINAKDGKIYVESRGRLYFC